MSQVAFIAIGLFAGSVITSLVLITVRLGEIRDKIGGLK